MIDKNRKTTKDLFSYLYFDYRLKVDLDNTITIRPFEEKKYTVDDLKIFKNNLKNSNHIEWIYKRLINVHNENPNYDYMLKLKKLAIGLKKIFNNA